MNLKTNAKKGKLVVVIYSLEMGGAERIISTIANYFQEQNWSVTFILLCSESTNIDFKLNKNLDLIYLNTDKKNRYSIFLRFARVYKLRKYFRIIKPDIVISVQHTVNILSIISATGLNIPVISTEHSNPFREELPILTKIVYRLVMPKTSYLVTLFADAVRFYESKGIKRVKVIPNPAMKPFSLDETNEFQKPEYSYILSVGRFVEEKNFPLLIKAFGEISEKFCKWKLIILGDGEKYPEIKNMITLLDLSDKVILPGKIHNVLPYYENASIYVSSSNFEGFQLAIGEALAFGLPVISTKSYAAIDQMVKQDINGYLVEIEDQIALENAIKKLLENPQLREQFSKNSLELAKKFSFESVMEEWEELFTTVLLKNLAKK